MRRYQASLRCYVSFTIALWVERRATAKRDEEGLPLRQFAAVPPVRFGPKLRVLMRDLPRLVLLCLAVATGSACGGEGRREGAPAAADPGRQTQHIIRTTASPFCPGKTLDSCPSPKAGEWRQDVHAWTQQGVPSDEIRSRLQARTPGFELRVRPARWSSLIPIAALLFSTLVMWLVARRLLRRKQHRAVPSITEHRDDLDRRLDEEIRRLVELS